MGGERHEEEEESEEEARLTMEDWAGSRWRRSQKKEQLKRERKLELKRERELEQQLEHELERPPGSGSDDATETRTAADDSV